MRNWKMLLAPLALVFLLGCPSTPKAPANPALHAAIDIAKDAWVLAVQGCQDAQSITGDSTVVSKCKPYLEPAYSLILASAKAYDASGQPDICALDAAVADIALAVQTLNGLASPAVSIASQDAVIAVHTLATGKCADAGADAGVDQ